MAPGIRRIVARNPSPFTFRGTGTYVVGDGEVAVIDPGPDLDEHVAALLAGLSGEQVTHILITHTHRDHSPAAAALKAATGAPTYGFGPHAGGKRGDPAVEEGGDWDFTPDVTVHDGDAIAGAGWRFEAVHTPGHTSNHLCFALPDQGILFSGDHVMGWSTSVIAPPDGDMSAYMASLDKLLGRRDAVYWPTHGPAITEPQAHVRAFVAHRREREAGILDVSPPAASGSTRSSTSSMSGFSRGCAARQGDRCMRICLISPGAASSKATGPPTIDAVYRPARF